jgi:hypothetical protein
MYRLTKSGSKWLVVPIDIPNEYTMADISILSDSGEIVIIVEDLETLEDMDIELDSVGIPIEDIEVIS